MGVSLSYAHRVRLTALAALVTVCAAGACGGETRSSGSGGVSGAGGGDAATMGGSSPTGGSGGGAGSGGAVDAAVDAPPEAAPTCSTPAANASATGTIPSGSASFGFSVFYRVYGECGDNLAVVLLETASALGQDQSSWPKPFVRIHVDDKVGTALPATIEVDDGSKVTTADGTVDLSAKFPAPAGTFSVAQNGVVLSGSFSPGYCEMLDVLCP